MLKKLVILLFCIIYLCGCTKEKSSQEISFASWGSITEVKILKKIISEFEKENPNIKINFIHIPQNYFQKIHLLFASNTAPDVIFINNLYLPIYKNQLENLSDHIITQEYFPQALDSLTIENKLLAIPRDVSNQILYVNTEIIKNPEKIQSIEDIIKLSYQAKEKGAWTISFEDDIYWAMPYITYFGETFDEKFNFKTSNAINFYNELRYNYKISPKKSDLGSLTNAQLFLDNKMAIYLSGRWMYPILNQKAKFNWIVIPFPIGKNPIPCDSSGWAISKNSKNKENAIKFVKYLASEKSAKYFTETGLIIPARISTAQILNTRQHNQKAFLTTLKNSKSYSTTQNYKKLIDKNNLLF